MTADVLLCRYCGIRPAFDMTGFQCVECASLFAQMDATSEEST